MNDMPLRWSHCPEKDESSHDQTPKSWNELMEQKDANKRKRHAFHQAFLHGQIKEYDVTEVRTRPGRFHFKCFVCRESMRKCRERAYQSHLKGKKHRRNLENALLPPGVPKKKRKKKKKKEKKKESLSQQRRYYNINDAVAASQKHKKIPSTTTDDIPSLLPDRGAQSNVDIDLAADEPDTQTKRSFSEMLYGKFNHLAPKKKKRKCIDLT